MNNFFKFEKDILFEDTPLDPSMKFKFQAYANTAWFNLDGYAYPNSDGSPTIFKIEDAVLLPAGNYALDLNRDLKGAGDAVYLASKDGSQKVPVRKDSIQVEKQQYFDLVFEFTSRTHYFEGEYFSELQEDYGKDYQIKINLISGGLYEREKYIAVWKGDINRDGRVDWEDLYLLTVFEAFDIEIENADLFRFDVNKDGEITSADVTALRRYLLGLDSLYEVKFVEKIADTEG